MAAPHMRMLVRDYTLDKAQAKPPTPVDPTGLISFARQAPDADSQPQVNPKARSKAFRNKHSSLQVSVRPSTKSLHECFNEDTLVCVLCSVVSGSYLGSMQLISNRAG